VIHLAWDKLNEYKNPEHLSMILDSHKAFLRNMIGNGCKDVTVAGTVYEYGMREGLLDESMPAEPTLPYPLAKNLLREYLQNLSHEYHFEMKWVRIFYVFGEIKERKNLYTHLMTAINNGEKTFNMSGGEQVRDFLTPDEIAVNIVKIALQNKVTGIINCCSGHPVKLGDFIERFLLRHNYKLVLNKGYYPYPDYEPMACWGSVKKLRSI
jgi:dTDP-6-deoxy-L-talose 4-dehydrogenase (NAD+)